VPALVGRDYGDALGVLRVNDLAVGRVERRLAERQAPGSVIDQHPRAGTFVDPGSSVSLVIAERVPECVVPNVIGNYRQAVEMLQRQGFRVTTQGPSERSASVVGQMPAAGTRTACGSTVTVITRSASIEQDPTGGSPPTHRIIDIFRRVDPGMQIRPPPERVD
jgi:serine/threonine-protein kinase